LQCGRDLTQTEVALEADALDRNTIRDEAFENIIKRI
jgi:hypothetical protein